MPKISAVLSESRVNALTLAERIAIDDPLTRHEVKTWKGWSDSTIDRYVARGMPVTRRPGMRDFFVPSRVNAFLRGELPALPVPKRGRPRKRRD